MLFLLLSHGFESIKLRKLKVTFTGPESSGKSTISKAIAQHFDGVWFAEYARDFLMERDGEYQFKDLEIIARAQESERKENEIQGMNIYDTENIVLYIWSKFKYEKVSDYIVDLVKNQNFDHYFLCSPEGIPWEEDPLRESPNHRGELFELYRSVLEKEKVSFTILTGSAKERMETATAIIQDL